MNETDLTPVSTPPNPATKTGRKRKKETKNLTKRNGVWYFHHVVNGKRSRTSLFTPDLLVAKAKRDALLKANAQAEVDRVLGRDSRPPAALGEVFKAYLGSPAVRANAATRERNIADLERLVRVVHGARCEVRRLSSGELSKQLVRDWQTKRLEAAAAEHAGDRARLEAVKRGLNSTLTHVQSLFSEEARDAYQGLYLPPNVGEFAEALPVPARKQEEPEQLTDEAVAALLEKMTELEKDGGAWAAFQLMTWGGLRNAEALHARESWLTKVPLVGYRLAMRPDKDFLPKGNSRAVIMPAAIVEAILARLPAKDPVTGERPSDHLVPGEHPTDRHEAVYRRLNAWLKGHGVGEDAGKIAYRLRKYFLAKVSEQQGVLQAQAAAGHASRRTTEDHYIGKPKMAEPIRLAGGIAESK